MCLEQPDLVKKPVRSGFLGAPIMFSWQETKLNLVKFGNLMQGTLIHCDIIKEKVTHIVQEQLLIT